VANSPSLPADAASYLDALHDPSVLINPDEVAKAETSVENAKSTSARVKARIRLAKARNPDLSSAELKFVASFRRYATQSGLNADQTTEVLAGEGVSSDVIAKVVGSKPAATAPATADATDTSDASTPVRVKPKAKAKSKVRRYAPHATEQTLNAIAAQPEGVPFTSNTIMAVVDASESTVKKALSEQAKAGNLSYGEGHPRAGAQSQFIRG
jgi:hypothetical protein